ncbi:MAG: hypothetical protein ACE5GM_00725 [bacterium]
MKVEKTLLWLLLIGLWVNAVQSTARAEEISSVHSGVVITVINTKGYTYIEYKHEDDKMWVAVPQMEVKVGDRVKFEGGYMMSDFHSKSLNRTFSTIFFVGEVEVLPPPES